MKSLVLLLTFLAVSFADNIRCPVVVDDSYFINGEYYGSAYNASGFYSLLGMFDEALYYDENNSYNSMLVTNASTILTNGVTGEIVAAGWSWQLVTGSGVYRMSKFNGEFQQCTQYDAVSIPQTSQVVANLFQIYPFSQEGYKVRDDSSILCQGLDPSMVEILTIGFEMEDDGDTRATFVSTLSNSSNIMTKVIEMRPLQSSDASRFINRCKQQAEVSNGGVRLHQSLYGRFKELLPKFE